MRDDGQIEILAAEHLLQPLRPFQILDLGADADLAKLGRDDLAAPAGIGWRRQLQRQGQVFGPCLLQQRTRLGRVMRRPARQIDIVGMVRREMRADRRAIAEHRAINDGLPVDGMRNRLPDADIRQVLGLVVGRQDGLTLGRTDDHAEARIGLELWQRLRSRIARESVDIACHHRCKGSCRIRNELEGGFLERHRVAPVIRIARKLYPVALNPARECEGAGADRRCLCVLDAFRRDDHGITPGKVGDETAIRVRQGDLHCQRIHRIDRGDAGEKTLLRVGRIFRPCAIQREFHILGIHCRAVMEFHPAVKGEGIDKAVIGDRP